MYQVDSAPGTDQKYRCVAMEERAHRQTQATTAPRAKFNTNAYARVAICVLAAHSLACATVPAQPPEQSKGVESKTGLVHCDATLQVMRPGVVGAEHVDSERLQLLSRRFAEQVYDNVQAPSARFDVTRLGRSEMLRIDVTADAQTSAQQLCETLVEQATALPMVVDDGASRWLIQQKEEMQTRQQIETENLRRFYVEHAIVIPLEEDMQTQAEVLRQLEVTLQTRLDIRPAARTQLEAAVEQARARAQRLASLLEEEGMLKRQLGTTEAVVRVLETRQSELRLDRMLNPTLRVVDVCRCTAPSETDDAKATAMQEGDELDADDGVDESDAP